MTEDKLIKLQGSTQVIDNPWRSLRKFTTARIGLGRAGISQPTKHHLDFQLAHARARDAVHSELDIEKLQQNLNVHSYTSIHLRSAAGSRSIYLQRPDLGRRLDDNSEQHLQALEGGPPHTYDIAFIIADGLSAFAVEEHAVNFLNFITEKLKKENWKIAPIVIVEQGRVAVSDEIGSLLGADQAVILIGERPGLSSPDSLGIYLTFDPKIDRNDADRNCISNVRTEGQSYKGAAHKLFYLLSEARRRKYSGVNLKDEAEMIEHDNSDKKSVGNFLVSNDD
jgi:ethanolamine ammonia-lyase small subunit